MSSTPYIPSIVVDQVITALAAFIQPFVGSATPIIRQQENRVPPPLTAGQPDPLAFVSLRETILSDLETPIFINSSDVNVQQASVTTPTRIDVQVNFYGVASADWCKAVKAVYRSPYAPDQFPLGIKPLYCSDGIQGALITGEEQYENRWILNASLQYNPVVIVPQQSATELKTNIFEDLP
jgi:hypothetical protein